VDAGKIWDAPISGTQAHSWVQTFDNELDSFIAYSEIFPDKCLLLIDTYNVLDSGLPNAIEVARQLKKKNKQLLGVRIDSGDLAYLAVEVYRNFKKAGFPDIKIALSNDLDEYLIESIVQQIKNDHAGSSREEMIFREEIVKHLVYGVGTKLITGGKESALGGVFKLVALDGQPKIKVSENASKTLNPGRKQVWRVIDNMNNYFIGDILSREDESRPGPGDCIIHPVDRLKKFQLPENITCKPRQAGCREKQRFLQERLRQFQ